MREAARRAAHIHTNIKWKVTKGILTSGKARVEMKKFTPFKKFTLVSSKADYYLMVFNLYLRARGTVAENHFSKPLQGEEMDYLIEMRQQITWNCMRLHAIVKTDVRWQPAYAKKKMNQHLHVICTQCHLANVIVRHSFNHWATCPHWVRLLTPE
jgi:hypothetical protein